MGAQSSALYSHEIKNPTRMLHSTLQLHLKSSTFTFSQDMKKGVGEEQLLSTRCIYTGSVERLHTDVHDPRSRRTVQGNPVYLLHTERVRFEVEWGNEWYQCKKGRLTREDVLRAEREAGLKRKLTPIITSTGPAGHALNHSVAPTVPPSPSRSGSAFISSGFGSSPSPSFPLTLPPAAEAGPRGFSHSAPLSPAPLSQLERQRSHIDAETGLGERPVQTVTALDKTKTGTAAPSSSSPVSSSSGKLLSSSTAASPSVSCASPAAVSFQSSRVPRVISITYNGSHHAQLQQATSLEEMTELLQHDSTEWSGTFSSSALQMRVELLTQELRIDYFKPKFEYLWAQVQDECPVIMCLSNVFHDGALVRDYMTSA